MMRANDYDYDDDYEFSDLDDWDPAPDELGYDSEDDPLDKEWDEGDVPYDDEQGILITYLKNRENQSTRQSQTSLYHLMKKIHLPVVHSGSMTH